MNTPDRVRLTIERVDLRDIAGPTEVLMDLTEPEDVILEHALAWTAVRGHAELGAALTSLFSKQHPDGWCAVVNRPHSVAILATWPWCPGPHDLCSLYGMCRPSPGPGGSSA